MFNSIYKILRSKCFNCHKLKIKEKLITFFYLKLSLIKLGFLGDARALDSLFYSVVLPNSNSLGINSLNLDLITEFLKQKDINLNQEEMTVSTEEANTQEHDNNGTEDNANNNENDEEEENEDWEEGKTEKKKRKQQPNKKKTKVRKDEEFPAENLDFSAVRKPLLETKLINITKILQRMKEKPDSTESDLNSKILLR